MRSLPEQALQAGSRPSLGCDIMTFTFNSNQSFTGHTMLRTIRANKVITANVLAFVLIGLLACTDKTQSQENVVVADSMFMAHQDHHAHYDSLGVKSEEGWDSLHGILHHTKPTMDWQRNNKQKIFGWHPHYMGSSYQSYNFHLLWGVSYFTYRVHPESGAYTDIYDWRTTPMIDSAQKAGTKVFLTTANFGTTNNRTFLNSPRAQQTFIDSIVVLLDARDADGVTVDFENVPESHREAFSRFIARLSKTLKAHRSGLMVTMTLPGIIKNKAFDIATLSKAVDLFLIMGYDYYYSGSPDAGPVAPLASGEIWAKANLETSVQAYLNEGMPKNKLILSLPYYGRRWETRNADIPSPTLRSLGSALYRTIRAELDPANAQVDPVSRTKYHITDTLRGTAQLWFDDSETLGAKYDWILQSGIAGVGIWALGYDNGYTELWDVLGEKFGE